MAKVVLIDNNIGMPTLILQNRNFDNIGSINEASDFNYKENFNDANECSFTIYKELESIYDEIYDHRIVYIPEFEERFEITISVTDEDCLTKTISMKSLCQAELSQVILRDIEINSEDDIARNDYDENFATVFYRDINDLSRYSDKFDNEKYADYTDAQKKDVLKSSSLLHRLLSDKCTHYTIGHVDETLWDIQRTFQISGTSVYDELVGEISEEIGCLFEFDSMTRTINIYDLYRTCCSCGYRGEFTSDTCPKCNSEDLLETSHWKDTSIYIDNENLSSSISLETNADELKNCFYVTGGDDLITSTVRLINPGDNYIYHFSEDTLKDMPEELMDILNNYENEYRDIYNGTSDKLKFVVPEKYRYAIQDYNKIVENINTLFNKELYKKLCTDSEYEFRNYPELISSMYEVFDLEGFMYSSMMPTVDISGVGIDDAMDNIDNGFKTGYVEKNPDYKFYDDKFEEYNLAIRNYSNDIKNAENDINTYNDEINKIKIEAGDNPLTEAQKRKIEYYKNKISASQNAIKIYENKINQLFKEEDKLYDELEKSDIPEYIHVDGHFEYYLPLRSFSKTSAESAVTQSAKMYCGASYYELSVSTKKFTKPDTDTETNGSWTGTIILKSLTKKKENSDEYVTKEKDFELTIPYDLDDDSYIAYSQQQLNHAISDKDELSKKQITSLGLKYSEFKKQLKYYSYTELKSLYEMFNACLTILTSSKMEKRDEFVKKLYDDYYKFYTKRMSKIEEEIAIRESELIIINMLYCLDDNFGTKDTFVDEDNETVVRNVNIIGDFINEVKEYLNIYNWVGEYKNTFRAYIREDDYNNSNYISDSKDNQGLVDIANDLLQKANQELYKASTTQYTLSANLINLFALNDYSDFKNIFNVGNWLRLGVDGKVYKLRLLSYSYNADSLDSIDVEFSTVEKIWNAYSDVQSVINSASSMATSYSSVMHQYEKSQDNTETINNWLSDGFNATSTKFANNENQEVTFNEHGLLLRKRVDSVDDSYEPYQAKIISNGLYVTSDNWETVETGIGKIGYYDPDKDNKYVETYGVIAKTIVGKLFLGEELKIFNKSGGLKFDDTGLSVVNNTNGFYINPTPNGEILKITKDENPILSFNSDGDLSITGNINATTGTIANFTISNDALHTNKDGSYGFKENGTIYFGTEGLSLSDKFYVDDTGKITATDADITGGKIANFNIGKDSISTGLFKTEDKLYFGKDGLSLSNAFYINADGTGHIANFDIDAKSIHTGDYNTEGTLYFGNNGLSLSNNFRVSKSGNMTANNATFKGFKALGSDEFTVTTIDDNIIIKDNVADDTYLGEEVNPYIQVRYSSETRDPFTMARIRNAVKIQAKEISFQSHNGSKFVDDSSITPDIRCNAEGTLYNSINITNLSTSRLFVDKSAYLGYEERRTVIMPDMRTYIPSGNRYIYFPCEDGEMHDWIRRNSSGNKFYVGWNGEGSDGKTYSTELILRGTTVSLGTSGGTAVVSDERLKNSFKSLDEFDKVFMDIEPCAFKYNNGTSGRFHFGAKAQNIKDAFINNGFTTKDFGGFIQYNISKDDEDYQGVEDPMGLIYTEFTMWNTHMIQKAIKLIESQQKEIEELKRLITEKSV